jgi:hypothetical protein
LEVFEGYTPISSISSSDRILASMMVDILGKWLTKLLMPTLSRSKTIIRRLRKLVDLEAAVHCTNLTAKGRGDDILAK